MRRVILGLVVLAACATTPPPPPPSTPTRARVEEARDPPPITIKGTPSPTPPPKRAAPPRDEKKIARLEQRALEPPRRSPPPPPPPPTESPTASTSAPPKAKAAPPAATGKARSALKCRFCGKATRAPVEGEDLPLCSSCRAEAVTTLEEADLLLGAAKTSLRGLFGIDLAGIATPLELASSSELLEITGREGAAAVTRLSPRKGRPGLDYKILALRSTPRSLLQGVLAHELFHVAQGEAAGAKPRDPALREGSAQYACVKVLRARGGGDAWIPHIERDRDPCYGEGYRRFVKLVAAVGESSAIDTGRSGEAFPEGF